MGEYFSTEEQEEPWLPTVETRGGELIIHDGPFLTKSSKHKDYNTREAGHAASIATTSEPTDSSAASHTNLAWSSLPSATASLSDVPISAQCSDFKVTVGRCCNDSTVTIGQSSSGFVAYLGNVNNDSALKIGSNCSDFSILVGSTCNDFQGSTLL